MASKDYLDCSSTDIGAHSWFDLSKSDYAKVIFSDLYHNPDSSVGCRFQITDNVHEDPSDYVGLFKVGYENLSQCLVSKLLSDTECEEDGKMLRCTFKSYELPKLDNGFYQFLYVTRDNEVCGASMPFEIKQSLTKEISSDDDIVADKTEDDFLVVRSTIAEQNRNLQDLINKMNQKTMDQEKFYSMCISKLSKDQIQLESELKSVREEKDKLTEDCRKLLEEKNAISKANDGTVQYLEDEISNLAIKIEDAYEKFRGLEKVKHALEKDKDRAIQEKAEIQKLCDRLMNDLDSKIVSVNLLQQELNQKQEHDSKKAEEMEHNSLLASQLEDSKLMIAALEESKLLVMNEVTQLTESNAQIKETLKELRCENLALKMKLRDADILNDKVKHRNQNLKCENSALKLHFVDTQNLQTSSSKVQHSAVKPVRLVKKSHAPNLVNEEKKILNVDSSQLEVESMKSQCDKIQSELVEKESIISKLKEDCLKKDAVVEYLSKEKNNIQRNSNVMEDALNDSVLRLKEAAEIYKKQYLEIEKLKKKLEKAKSKCKERHSSESSSVRGQGLSASEFLDELLAEHAKPTQHRNSDSDTGEHVLGHGSDVLKSMVETVPVEHQIFQNTAAVLEHQGIQSSIPSELLADMEEKMHVAEEKFKDVFGQSLDISYLAVASTSNQTPSNSRQSPELQSMIDQNLAKLSLSKSKEDEEDGEVLYSIPCPVCDADIGIYTTSSEEMIKHLEMQHKQQLCPVCGKLFDMTLPQKYFQFHVEDHFMKGNKK